MRIKSTVCTSCAVAHVATSLYAGKFCPLACELTLNYATFNDTDAWLSRKVRSCRSNLRTSSLYLCFDQFCDGDKEAEAWIQEQTLWCEEHAGVTLPAFHDIVDRWSSSSKADVRRVGAEEAMKLPMLNEVVIPYNAFFARAYTTMASIPVRQFCQTRD
jgi:hypothetical protein